MEWLQERGLLRGPFCYVDYWPSVLGLEDRLAEAQRRLELVDPTLFRVGLDRPDLEVPPLRQYLLLFLLGPVLLLLRRFRRLGARYRLTYRSETGREVQDALGEYRLELDTAGSGRVHVRKGDAELARDLVDPYLVAGFSSLFHATYKLPLASFTAILLAGTLTPLLYPVVGGREILDLWLPAGFPLLAVALWLVYRDLVTALLGALPVVAVRFLFPVLRPGPGENWAAFAAALGLLFVLYLCIDWFFMPRPVPPVLMLFTREGPGRAFDREEDGPWWLDGDAYWVWRYLMLSPAEINKFWERDWERVELWIRADGPGAGALEWVVTDTHYRELWIPYDRLGPADRLEAEREEARVAADELEPGFWLVEVDADLVFHSPEVRAVTFMPDTEGGIPSQSASHMVSALWTRTQEDRPESFRRALELAQIREGADVFADVPEATRRMVARHLLAQPWRYWRYPLGAATSRPHRLYGRGRREAPPLAADRKLQVKAPDDAGPEGSAR